MRSAKATVDRFDRSWSYARQNHHERWNRNYKLYNNKRAIVGYKGITNTFVPLAFSTVETLTASLCAGRPSIDFTPQDMYKYIQSYVSNGKKPDLKALNAQYDYYWDCDNWDLKTIKTVRSGFQYGTAAEWVYWDGDKPRVINMNIRDAIVDPSLTDPMQLWTDPNSYYTGRRYLTTVDALRDEKIVDPDKPGDLKPRFKSLDKIKPGLVSGDQTDKEQKDQGLGSLSESPDTVEVIEIWDGKRIKSVAQRHVTIEDRENKLGIHCLVLHRFIADESIIYGKAILDPIAAPQELLNDVTNQRTDAVTDALNPQFTLDPIYSSWLPKMKNTPGSGYPFKPGALQYIQKPVVPGVAFNTTTDMKNDIREATAADQVVKGVAADQQTTATEVRAQLNQAGERFSIYVRMLEREGLYQRAKIVYHMMLYYIRDKQLVPVSSMDGPQFRAFNPHQFDNTYEPQIRLEANVKNAKATDAQQATEAYQILIQDPTNDLWEAKKILYPKMFDLSEEELDRIIGSQKPAPAQPPMGMPGQQPLDGQPPVDPAAAPPELQQPAPAPELAGAPQ